MAETSPECRPRTVPDGAAALLECTFDQTTLAALRAELTRCGASSGLSGLALSNFVLAVNEITTNAVRYAGGRGGLQLWCHGDRLWCQVIDDGPGIPRTRLAESHRPRLGHLSGHGLWLARRICDSVDIESDRGSGTRVLLRYALRSVDR